MNPHLLILAALTAAAPAGRFAEDVQVGDPISVENLTVFPLRLQRAALTSDALSLDEAMQAGLVTVREVSEGAVNTLLVSNGGTRPVYAMAGELLVGGKQDRIIGQSLVLPPRATDVAVSVFCVEHGRWNGASTAFQSAASMAHPELRKKAFGGSQAEVWREVAAANARLRTENASDTYRPAATKVARDTAPLVARLVEALDGVPGVAGIAVAVNGRIVGVEYFASPRLFSHARQKLLASYAAQALAAPSSPPPAAPPTSSDVGTFAVEAERGSALKGSAVDPSSGRTLQTSYLAK
jgi:ARG and Rhodanese-Phosphatase-superfamily-associated Protein domain